MVDRHDNPQSKPKSKVHSGHRKRMDDRVLKDPDFEGFAYHEMLEYLLYMGVPYKDTNKLAHELIDRFGSFSNVFYASVSDLMAVPNMTKRAACTIASIIPISRWVHNQTKNDRKIKIKNVSDMVGHLSPFFYNKRIENIYMVCLDSADYVICTFPLAKGFANNAVFDVRELVTKANSSMASKVIIAHNHPSSILSPSLEDIVSTSRANVALQSIYVTLIDSIIFVPSGEYYSFYQRGILKDIVGGAGKVLGSQLMKETSSQLSDQDMISLKITPFDDNFLYNIYQKTLQDID
jgi:DNA repair protein RadC